MIADDVTQSINHDVGRGDTRHKIPSTARRFHYMEFNSFEVFCRNTDDVDCTLLFLTAARKLRYSNFE